MICIGCGRNLNCVFPNNLNHFPYRNDQILKFINTQSDTCSFTISNSIEYVDGCSHTCSMRLHADINSNQNGMTMISEILIWGDAKKVWDLSINIYLIKSQFNNESFSIISIQTEHGQKKYKYNDISKLIGDIVTIENENNKIIKKIVVVNGKGIVSYTTADGEEWKLVE